MANIRRPGNLTTVLGSVKNKIETLEARGTTTGSSVSSISSSGNENANTAPGITSNTAPYTYKRVIKAYIYGSKVTGNTPRMELYFGEDPQIAQGEYVQIQGISGTSTDTWEEMSPALYAVYATDTPPWDDGARADQDWRDTPTTGNNGDTVTHTVWFNPDIEVPITYSSTSGRELITTRLIDSVSATGTTVTVNFNSTHVFREGDIISVDLTGDLYGVDGLFKVSNVVDNNTIEYELSTALASPISLSGGTLGTKYVYPVAHRYVEDGTIWNDTSVSPAKVYVWKEYRWYDTSDPIGDVAAAKDGIAPSPVTNLTATSTTIPGANGQGGTAEITVSWTAPTTRSNGDPIGNYLGYYEVQYKRSTEANWSGRIEAKGSETSVTIKDALIRLLTTYDIRVYVYDIMEQSSTPVSTTVTTTNFAETLNAPSKPILSSRLGTITVTWDGLDSAGNTPVQGVQYVEVHYSTTTGFTPGPTTLYTTFPITLEGNYAVVSDLNYNTPYYFKLRFVRSDGFTNETSDPSVQETAQVAPLVDTDIINSTLNTWPFNGGVVPAGALADGSLNASSLFGANVIVQSAIAANAIGADQIAAGSIVSGKIAANAITASEIAANTISAGMLKANSIEADKIAAGAITASIINSKEVELKATPTATQRIVLNSAGITAYNTSGDTTFFLNGTSGTINASAINVQNISAANITTGTLNADRIASESITAGKLEADLTMTKLIKTGAAGTNRIEIRGSTIANPGIVHLDGSGGSNFRFYANGFSYLNNLELDTATLSGTLTVSGTVSGGSFSGGTFTGGTFRTASSGQRVIVDGGTNSVRFMGTDGLEKGEVSGGSTNLILSGNTGIAVQAGGATVFSVTSTGVALSPGDSFNSNLPVVGNITSTGSMQADTFVRSGIATGNFATLGSNGTITSTGTITSGSTIVVGTMTISTTNPIVRWNGSGLALNVTSSDRRIKAQIETITEGLSVVTRLNPVTFDSLVDTTDKRIPGFIAQEVQEVFSPELGIVGEISTESVETDIDLSEGPLKTLDYQSLIPYLTRAIQELAEKNIELESKISALEER